MPSNPPFLWQKYVANHGAEIAFGLSTTQGQVHFLNLMVLLKAFQRLGYFPKQKDIPKSLVNHIRFTLALPEDISVGYEQSRTLIANAVVFHNAVDLTSVLRQLIPNPLL